MKSMDSVTEVYATSVKGSRPLGIKTHVYPTALRYLKAKYKDIHNSAFPLTWF